MGESGEQPANSKCRRGCSADDASSTVLSSTIALRYSTERKRRQKQHEFSDGLTVTCSSTPSCDDIGAYIGRPND
eukprot:CAMPEP_0115829198 /NCGR_PEP_ID=MMETSP0287-20121206/973_1 /TAXON_ID=412157 /ORGANISM="Chrysochromulina rotalis, Strain UIO044" /LENGTH=74 /DNA_ID=CAMNT_0003282453 /DNA_START=1237 /DNA_END=1458 /DNA_ORIENTATION=+